MACLPAGNLQRRQHRPSSSHNKWPVITYIQWPNGRLLTTLDLTNAPPTHHAITPRAHFTL